MVDWKKEYKLFGKGGSKPLDEDVPPKTPWYKKEVSLKRASKDDPAPVEDEGPKTPWYKKELSLKRAPKAEAPVAEAEAEPVAEDGATRPWYKKELSLKRAPKAEAPVAEAEGEPVADGDAKRPWYKKELSLKRPPKAEALLVEAEAGPVAEDGAKRPWYKKELSLKRAPKAEALLVEAEAGPVADDGVKRPWYKKELSLKRAPKAEAPVAEADVPVTLPEPEPEPVPTDLEPVADVPITLPEPEPEPETAPEPAPEPQPFVLPEPVAEVEPPLPEPTRFALPEPISDDEPEIELPEPPPARAVSWVDAVLSGAPLSVEPAPQAEEPQADALQTEALPGEPELPERVAEVEGPELVAEARPEPEPLRVLPPVLEPLAVEPEPVPETAAVAEVAVPDARPINPPVRADELPPLDDELPVVPWYKRDLSLDRKRRKQEPEAVEAVEPRAKPTPFWKKEITFTLRGKAPRVEPDAAAPVVAPPAEPEPVAAVEPEAKPVPFWKKELGRKSKPQPAAATKPKTAAEPFWKRGLSLPTLSLPQRGGGRGPVPKQLVGLKVGASQLAAAKVSNNGHAEVLQVARTPLEGGIVVAGELRDPDALADALKEFFTRNKLPKRAVRLGIANNRIGVRTFEIVGIEDSKQLANAIRFRAQEALPIPIEEAVLDHQVLEETVNEEGENVRKILLVVAYRELVDRYVAACRKAGIALVGIDLEAFALLRALAAPVAGDVATNAALVAVAVGHDRSTFAVSDGRVCEFTRVLDWGGQNLSVAIARALDLSPSEADPVKHVLSLGPGPAPEGLTEEQAAAAREAVVRQVANFARELVSSLQFYQSQPNSLGIGEIVLTGGTAHLNGFAAELERVIGVKVRVGDPLVRVKVPKRFREPEQIGSLSVAIGLGIED